MRAKNLPTRKKAALIWAARAMMVLVVLVWLGPWAMTPQEANRQELEPLLAEAVEVVHQTAGPENNQMILSWNDDFVCLSACYPYRFFKWNCRSRHIAEREEGRPFTAGMLGIPLAEGDDDPETRWNRSYVVYGRIESEDVAAVEIVFRGDDGDGPLDYSAFRKTATLQVTDMERHEGQPWFLYFIEPELDLTNRACAVTAIDEAGNSLGTFQAAGKPRWE